MAADALCSTFFCPPPLKQIISLTSGNLTKVMLAGTEQKMDEGLIIEHLFLQQHSPFYAKMVASDESGSIGYDNDNFDFEFEPEQPLEPQEESSQDDSHHSMGNNTKQNSIFSLTLDEIQCKSGRNFGSMNMDEFLANIWSVEEENQTQQQPSQCDQDASDKDTTINPITLSRQGSFSIPTPLCKKTVDEVWSEIDRSRPQHHDPDGNISNSVAPQRQQTIGEITLEDFLVKAGVVQESPSKSKPPPPKMESTLIQQQCGETNMGNEISTCLDSSFGIGRQCYIPMLGRQSKVIVGEPSCVSAIEKCHSLPESSSGGGAKNKKRIIDGPPEVVVERRQRRMIKNRESAARSRARKQAYTVELEAELNQLKEENTKLKQNVAESEQKRKQETHSLPIVAIQGQ
ncbi:Basic-leucine zipper transcription factor family protein [Prunus dulcis]|uniref:Basic-leucine zipper transcription factor family protein n=1 Tax=Prunus dulcis TaxID=3755 RepID=A0A4Y1RM87_PRUDU|nr:Basic-leucine zipper transcription factor family protein [Prunus dulcis]